jgi:hypothetical protein
VANDRSNDVALDIRINELQRMIIAEALYEYNLAHKGEPDGRCIRDEANLLEAFFSELDLPIEEDSINDISGM